MEFYLNKAEIAQMREVAAVFRASRTHSLPFLSVLHTPEEDTHYFEAVVFPENKIIVARNQADGRAFGFIAFDQEWVNHLYLLPEAQNQGVGSTLLKEAQKESRQLMLWTFQKNLVAQAFYEKHGFKAVKATDGAENEEKEPDVLLEWKL